MNVAPRDMLHAPCRGLLYLHSVIHRHNTRVSRMSFDTCTDCHQTHNALQILYNDFHPNCIKNMYSDGTVICVGVKLGLVHYWRNWGCVRTGCWGGCLGTGGQEITGDCRTVHNEDLHCLYSSQNIIGGDQNREGWKGRRHVARMGDKRNAYRVLVRKPEGKRPLWRHRSRWEDNIKVDFQKMGCESIDWNDLAQGKDKSMVVVNSEKQIWGSIKCGGL